MSPRDLGFDALPALLRARTVADVDRAFDALGRAGQRGPRRGHRGRAAAPGRRARTACGTRTTGCGWCPRGSAGTTGRAGTTRPAPTVDGHRRDGERARASPPRSAWSSPRRTGPTGSRELLRELADWTPPAMAAVHTGHPTGIRGSAAGAASPDFDGADPRGRRRCGTGCWPGTGGWRPTARTPPLFAAAARRRRTAARGRTRHWPRWPNRSPVPEVFVPWLYLPVEGRPTPWRRLLTTDHLPGIDRAGAGPRGPGGGRRRPASHGHLGRAAPARALAGAARHGRRGVAGTRPATTTVCWPPPASPASPTSAPAVRPPATSGTWPGARTASGWSRSAPPGVPGDPHHRDQLPRWLRGEFVPVVTDWTRLTEETT